MDEQTEWESPEQVMAALGAIAQATQAMLEGVGLSEFVEGMAFAMNYDAMQELATREAANMLVSEADEFLATLT